MTFTLDGVWFSISRRRPIKRYLKVFNGLYKIIEASKLPENIA